MSGAQVTLTPYVDEFCPRCGAAVGWATLEGVPLTKAAIALDLEAVRGGVFALSEPRHLSGSPIAIFVGARKDPNGRDEFGYMAHANPCDARPTSLPNGPQERTKHV